MDELKTVNCEQLMTTPLKPIEFCVDGMISTDLWEPLKLLKVLFSME